MEAKGLNCWGSQSLLYIWNSHPLGLGFVARGENGLDKGKFKLESKLEENTVRLFSSTH